MDLDQRLQQALEENARAPSCSSSKKFDDDWTPKAHSAKHVLTGHRDRVNAISFHPRYSVIASGGEDAMLKVWDWETGEFERTLKGHTRDVNDVAFDSKGNLLGAHTMLLIVRVPSRVQYSQPPKCLARPIYSSKSGTCRTNGRIRRRSPDTITASHLCDSCLVTSRLLAPVGTEQYAFSTSRLR